METNLNPDEAQVCTTDDDLARLGQLNTSILSDRGVLEDRTKDRDDLLVKLHAAGIGFQTLANASGLTKQRVFAVVQTAKAKAALKVE